MKEKVYVFTAEQAYKGDFEDTIVKVFTTEDKAKAFMEKFLNEEEDGESIKGWIKGQYDWHITSDDPTLFRANERMDYPNNHVECTIWECEAE